MSSLNTVQIDNNPDLVRDMNSKAVVSTDVDGLRRYKVTRQRTLAGQKEMQDTKVRLATIEKDMAALKSLVGELTTLRNRG